MSDSEYYAKQRANAAENALRDATEPPPATQIIDLMEALKKSLANDPANKKKRESESDTPKGEAV